MSLPGRTRGVQLIDWVETDVVIVGCGQAGLCLSYYLQQLRIGHVVLERDRPFSSWHNRWEGFRTNTPNWMNTLPMGGGALQPPQGFATRQEIVAYLDACVDAAGPPIEIGVAVDRAFPDADGHWLVHAGKRRWRSRCLALCTGAMALPNIPALAPTLPREVIQLHSSAYRRPEEITTGSVLVVGSASSGVQIGRLLAEFGRFTQLHIARSSVPVLPRHIMGIQTHRLIHVLGLFDVRSRSLLGKLMNSGLESRGDPIMRPTPKDLARSHGVVLHGKFTGYEDGNLRFADGSGLAPDDLTVVWCTGFRPDYGFVEVDRRDKAFHASGHPKHEDGVAGAVSGLYFVGLRYQSTVASHDIYGVSKDAKFIAEQIRERLEGGGRKPGEGSS